ncbi:DNA-3-methyladenine glycosylase [Gilvimarinus agarilyticus]|uniref:DNA-3-methyladenine glycosylase n=1 Tax=Reichenbachiella agariperforans TaxID=156994 RepID=UPI001C0843A2|nr:DNA-3-methyladenine glycosylase [Reichenbachiella agariperforans]MBU2887939.1 DNA-3-methyladenine glycosylase [Gilvimarinus agarilyticus]MBU2913387.1 DNA-3-methyladenine glycosylase [Reichenbachiella agariperforans]
MTNNDFLLPKSFYLRDDVVQIAKELLGKTLVTRQNEAARKGKIVETEAYRGYDDKACHASNGKRTPRTEVMYREGGCAYVYLCYGIHHLFNVVTNVAGKADAVLIRAVEPLDGDWSDRHPKTKTSNGPGKLSKAMGITMEMNTARLTDENDIWIEDAPDIVGTSIVASTRVGVDYAGEDALLPWRFYICNNDWVSKK